MTAPLVTLTDLTTAFAAPYLELVNDPVVAQTTDPGAPPRSFTKEQITAWLSGLAAQEDRRDFAILLSGPAQHQQFAGEVVINEMADSSANLRIALLPRYFDKGYGTKAMKLAIARSFTELGLDELRLSVYTANPRGIRVYTKLGFIESHREQDGDLTEVHMKLAKSQWLASGRGDAEPAPSRLDL